ncbi:MAG: glucosyltransferase domain-containing protein [Clostridia bacterium]|nr:glucosyltransferase domain-containing protein [Clostridia bacterium]
MIKLQEVKNELQDVYNRLLQQKTAFLWLCFLYYISYSAIIRANLPYQDDMGRALYGFKGWDNFSRYTSNFLSNILHGDSYLGDVSPLAQYVAIFVLALSGIILIEIFSDEDNKKFSIFKCLSVLPMGISPYFLECISYKFDAPYMAVSIFAMVFPFLFIKNERLFLATSLLGTLLMTTTYQASSGIYPAIALAIALKMRCNGETIKNILKFLSIAILGYIAGLLLFKFFIMKTVNAYAGTTIHAVDKMLFGVKKNLIQYFNLVKSDFKITWIILVYILIFSYLVNNIVCCKLKLKKAVFFLATPLTISIIILCSFGLYPLLQKPLFAPRAMYGIGVVLSIIGIQCVNSRNKFVSFFSKTTVFTITWLFISFSFVYGNALSEYNRYMQFNIYKVVSNIEELTEYKNNKHINLQFKNTLDFPLSLQNNMKHYRVLRRLVPPGLGVKTGFWHRIELNYFSTNNISKDNKINFDFKEDLTKANLPLVKDTGFNKIYAKDNKILVEFK